MNYREIKQKNGIFIYNNILENEIKNILNKRRKDFEDNPNIKTDFDKPSPFGLSALFSFITMFLLIIIYYYYKDIL